MMAEKNYQELHDEAVAKGLHDYRDPLTGYRVTTTLGHRARGKCCNCGCRHCPFGQESSDADSAETGDTDKKDNLS
jgi:hypothetical protein